MLAPYLQTNILKIGLYGFICGMSLLLSGNTLNYWLSSSSVNIKIVSLFAWVALPYSLKYIIAIFIDKYSIPYSVGINKNKVWLLFSQIMLIILLILLSFLTPQNNLYLIAFIAFLIAFFAVIQDIVINGNRIMLLSKEEQGYGNAMYTIGYRIGMMFSGAGIVFTSAFINWSEIYLVLASLYSILMFTMLFVYSDQVATLKTSWVENNLFYGVFLKPIEYFKGLKNTIWILVFIIFYLLSDNMLMIMLNPFLLEQGYNAIEIASVSKAFGSVMVIIGGFTGGIVLNKISIKSSLMIFCFINMLGHPFFIFLHYTGKNINLLYFITGYTAFAGGMLTVAYIMFISKLSEGKHATTIYALLSSAMGLSRVLFPSISGFIVDNFGWPDFFLSVTFISILSLLLVKQMPNSIYNFYALNQNNLKNS